MAVISIVKKLSIIRSSKRVRDLILSYVDEVSKFEAEGRPAAEFRALASLPQDRRYRFFGFLGEELDTYRKAVARPRTELESCAAWWLTKTARLARKAHHIAFAFPPEFARELEHSGVCPGDVLYDCICRTFETYREQFFKNDELGFVVGLHREKAHPHAHVLFYPQTLSGRMVNFSRLAPVRTNGQIQRIDFQGYVQDRFAANVKHWREVLKQIEQDREAITWPSQVLVASDAVRVAQEQTSPESVALTALKNADTYFESPDFEDALATLADAATTRVALEREQALHTTPAIHSVARNLAKNAPALEGEISRAQDSDIPALQLRAMRMAGRALELSAAIQGKPPEYLRVVATPRSVAAANRLRQAQASLNRYLVSEQERQSTVPLEALANRDLTPEGNKDDEPVLTEHPSARRAGAALRAISLNMTDHGITLDFVTSAEALARAGEGFPPLPER